MSPSPHSYSRSLFRSLTLTLTLGPAVIFAGVTAWSAWQLQDSLRTELVNQVNDDIASLAEVHLDSGPDDVAKTIGQRLNLSPLQRAEAYYLFGTGETGPRAGNLPESLLINPNYTERLETRLPNGTPVVGRATVFRNGDVLIVARDATSLRRNILGLTGRFLFGLALMLALSYTVASHFTRSLRNRIEAMNATMARVVEGHLDARVGQSGDRGRDYDEIGFLGQRIDRMIERAERLLELRKRVTDEVAHEVRSPLLRLDATLEAMKSEGAPANTLEEARDKISKCVKLLDGLLDMSSIEAQEGDTRNFHRIDLGALLGSLVDLYEPVAEDSGRRLLNLSKGAVWVNGEASQLGRLISNLLDNAVKYSNPGSDILVEAIRNGEQAVLCVRNEGPRIVGRMTSDIFVPFYRHPDMAGQGGHGLGLALCRSIAARHGGTLIIEPDLELTVFRFQMPLAPPEDTLF